MNVKSGKKMIERKLLKNNIELVTEKVDGAKSCAVGFFFSAGSRFEGMENRGISHFTEHMLFKGTKNFSAKELSLAFDSMGALINAYTEREEVCLFSVVPCLENNLEKALDLMCDMSENCIFPEDEFLKEKKVVQSEIESLRDDADESALDEVAAFVWKGTSLSKTIGASVEDVEKINRLQMIEWYEKYFLHGELCIFLAGNFDLEMILSKVEKLGQHKRVIKNPECHFNEKVLWNAGTSFVNADFFQEQIYLLFPFEANLSERESYCLSLLNTIAGDCLSSRLFSALREENALCYNVFSYYIIYENAAAWCACLSAEKKNILKAAKLLLSEVNDFTAKPFSQSEIERAKKHLVGEELLSAMDCEYLMRRNEKNFRQNIPLRNSSEIVDLIESLKKEEVNALAEKIFIASKKALLFYGAGLNRKMKKNLLEMAKN